MAFDFLKRNKKKEKNSNSNVESSSNNEFWESNVIMENINGEPSRVLKLPYADIAARYKDLDYLTDVFRNDTELHRRSLALHLITMYFNGDAQRIAEYTEVLFEGIPHSELDEIFLDQENLRNVMLSCKAIDFIVVFMLVS